MTHSAAAISICFRLYSVLSLFKTSVVTVIFIGKLYVFIINMEQNSSTNKYLPLNMGFTGKLGSPVQNFTLCTNFQEHIPPIT
jgi:hypothetical protein